MNKPPMLSAFLLPSAEQSELGSVESSLLVRLIRPVTFGLWIVVFCIEAQRLISGNASNFLVVGLVTLLFAGAHVQFWYEESEQGRRLHHAIERMRGRIYEDNSTGLPNSRHFVFELRRQMMRSNRSGKGFSLVLSDIRSTGGASVPENQVPPSAARAFRSALGEGDFVARLQGSVFAAIVLDDAERTAAEKARDLVPALGSTIPVDKAANLHPIVSITGYQGELEVREFLARAQRDLHEMRARGPLHAEQQRTLLTGS